MKKETILYYTMVYYTILYYTILYYTILYYTILYYTILYGLILPLEAHVVVGRGRHVHDDLGGPAIGDGRP